jgi:hypothetical protein
LSIFHKIASPRRILTILGVTALLLAAGGWATNRWLGGKIEATLVSKSKEQGLDLTWEHSLWDPWRGLHLTGLKLRSRGNDPVPLAELGSLDLSLSIWQFLGSGDRISSWQVRDSSIVLHDEEGAITLENVSLRMDARPGKLDFVNLAIKQAGTSAKLKGVVSLPSGSRKSAEAFRLNLNALRAILGTLDVRAGSGPFQVTGEFTVDSTKEDLTWSTKLTGQGKNLEWKGVRWTLANADGEFSSEGTEIRYKLSTAHGGTHGTASKADGGSPFTFKGALSDSVGHEDEYRANYAKHRFTVESLKGRADLWSLAGDIPAAADRRPESVRFKTFPEIQVKDAVLDTTADKSPWVVRSLSVISEDQVIFGTGDREIKANRLSASGSFDGSDWTLNNSSADLFGGRIALKGRYRQGVLHQSDLEMKDIQMSELKNQLGKKGGKGVLSVRYRGSIDISHKRLNGTGSMKMENAPIVEVPLLDQVYEIFSALLPGVERSKDGEFNAEFTANEDTIDVSRFEAKGGSSLTVSAVGTIDLTKGRVKGRARGKLVGLPGLVTRPLSRLLEMEVAGPYDDVRVKPQGPVKLASNTVSGTVGVAVDTLEETGKITGTILKEGIKVPFGWLNGDPPDEDKPKR